MVTHTDGQAAPGSLENVRSLLNTWLVPNDAHVPHDDLDPWLEEHGITDRAPLERLRAELRGLVEGRCAVDPVVNRWIRRYRVKVRSSRASIELHTSVDEPGAQLVLIVIEALANGTFRRLKACADCRWAFYDHTRNNSKRWCVMNATKPGGRSCGNLAKARRYRERRQAKLAR